MADPFADYEEDPFAAYAEADSVQVPQAKPAPQTEGDWLQMLAPYSTSRQPGESAPLSAAKDVASLPGRAMAKGIYSLTGAGSAPMSARELPPSGNPARDFLSGVLRDPWTVAGGAIGGAVAPKLAAAARLPVMARLGIGAGAGGVMANIPGATEFAIEGKPYDVGATTAFGAITGGLGEGAGKIAGKGVRVAEDAFRGMARVLADKSREYGQAGADDLRRFVQPLLNESLSESGLRAAIKKRVEAFAEAGDAAANETSPAAASIRNQIRQSAGVPANKRVLPSDQEIAKAELMNQAGSRWDPNGPNLSEPLTVGDLVGRAKFNAEMNARSGILKGSADQVAKTLDNLGDASSVLRGHGKETPVSYADFPNLLRRVNYAAFHPGTGVAPANANEISREAGDLFREEIADMMYNNPALSREIQSKLIAAKKLYAQAMRVEAMLRKDPTSINADRSALGWAANKVGMPVAIPLIARRAAQLGQGGFGLASRYVPPAVADALFVQPQRPTR
jgi:hypothetical protein